MIYQAHLCTLGFTHPSMYCVKYPTKNLPAALPLPKFWGLDTVLGEPAKLQLQLADLDKFEGQHNDRLGWHARNIMAVAPEARSCTDCSCLTLPCAVC